VERITQGFNNKKATVTLFLDIGRAFDNVWTTGLIAKLITAKISPHFIHIIHNYLQNRSFSVMHKNSYSTLQAGVPQGSLLGPTLFNIYINDIPSVENYSNVAISVYADDTNISVRSGSIDIAVRKLNSAIGLLEPWFRKWRIQINTKKCTITLFSTRLRHCRSSTHQVKIFNENRAWTKETKCLGVTLDSK
jgi:retron-type reverse transcriptase